MEYTVACNWDPELLDRIDYPEVKSLFGALPNSVISGGRPAYIIKDTNDEDIRNYIKRVHDKRWDFNYNINSTCLANRECGKEGFKQIIDYIEWVVSLGVTSVTIANANLINIVRKNFPDLKIKVSTFQKIATLPQAQRFEDMGVEAIMLSEHVNRGFKLLREIRKHVKCKLILIANVGCIFNCPNSHSHANSIAHSGIAGENKSLMTEAYHTYCYEKRLQDPAELVKIRWIRPDDVAYYEDIGIDMLKIIERYSTTDALTERMKAYHERKYDGNIIDLLGQMVDIKHTNKDVLTSQIKADPQNVDKAMRFYLAFSAAIPDLYYLDNSKLSKDFIKGFENRDCNRLSCDECGYCEKIANEVISVIDKEKLELTLSRLKTIRNDIFNGSMLY